MIDLNFQDIDIIDAETCHSFSVTPATFEDYASGNYSILVSSMSHNYSIGDIVVINEWGVKGLFAGIPTGSYLRAQVTHILKDITIRLEDGNHRCQIISIKPQHICRRELFDKSN